MKNKLIQTIAIAVISNFAFISSAKAGFLDLTNVPQYPVPETLSVVPTLGVVILGLFLFKKLIIKK